MNSCDVEGCDHKDDARVDSDTDIPEGWASVWLPDASGEHQNSLVCPKHVWLLRYFIDRLHAP